MRRALPSLLFPALCFFPGQEDRGTVLGRVVGRDGSPRAHAEVHFCSRPIPWVEEVGELDRLEARTDSRGKFRVELLPGRRYSAWARWEEGGRNRLTKPDQEVCLGRTIRLEEDGKEHPRVRIRLVGRERWKDHEPLRVRVVPNLRTLLILPLELDEKGEALLPFLPGKQCYVEVLSREGCLIAVKRVLLEREGRERIREAFAKNLEEKIARMKEEEDASGAEGRFLWGLPEILEAPVPPVEIERILLPPPFRVRFKVLSKEGGRSLSGVEVLHEASAYNYWYPRRGSSTGSSRGATTRVLLSRLGTTGAEGRAVFVVPMKVDSHGALGRYARYQFRFLRKGFAVGIAGWARQARGPIKEVGLEDHSRGESREIEVRLGRGFRIFGKILDAKGKGLEGITLLARPQAIIEYDGNSWSGSQSPVRLVRTGKEGSFAFTGFGEKMYPFSISALLPSTLLEDRSPVREGGTPSFPLVETWVIPMRWNQGGDIELDTLDLSKLRVLDLQVRSSRGGPARFAEVRLFPGRITYVSGAFEVPPSWCDRRGRVRILVPRKSDQLFVFSKEHGFFAGRVDSLEDQVPGEEKRIQVRISLRELGSVSGRVVDQKGRALPEVSISIRSSANRGGGDFLATFASRFNRGTLRGRTDEGGNFKLFFIPSPSLSFQLGFSLRRNDRTFQGDSMLQVDNESLQDEVIEILVEEEEKEGKENRSEPLPGRKKD